MRIATRLFSLVGVLFLASLPAKAGDKREDHQGGRTHGAPEPLTLAGLAVGAGGLALARRLGKRNRK